MQIISGRISRPQKVVIYGPEGIGKTTLGAAFPGALLLDVEQGSGHLDCDRINVEAWAEFCETLEALYSDRENLNYKTIVIDSADWLEKLATVFICSENDVRGIEDFGYGKGYVYLTEEIIRALALLDQLRNAGLNIVLIGHSTVVKRELPGSQGAFDRYELKCSKRVTALFKEWADAVLFLNYKIIVEEGADGKTRARGGHDRLLMTEHTAAFDAKNRWGLESEVKVGPAEDPLPVDIKKHLAGLEPKQQKKGTEKKKEKTELEKALEGAELTREDLKLFLDKQGINKLTKKVEAQIIENIEKVSESIAHIKGLE